MTKCPYCSKNISEFGDGTKYCRNCDLQINSLYNHLGELKNE